MASLLPSSRLRLLSDYGLQGDSSNAGEVRVSRLELKRFLGRMRERRAKVTRDQSALDTCWKAPSELGTG